MYGLRLSFIYFFIFEKVAIFSYLGYYMMIELLVFHRNEVIRVLSNGKSHFGPVHH